MSRKLTAAELAEPDVELVVALSTWEKMPDQIRKDAIAYSSRRFTWSKKPGHFVLAMPAYRFRELAADYTKLTLSSESVSAL